MQYRLCAGITERLPKIRKTNTESTVDGLGALGMWSVHCKKKGVLLHTSRCVTGSIIIITLLLIP